jgi:hypothetical protein
MDQVSPSGAGKAPAWTLATARPGHSSRGGLVSCVASDLPCSVMLRKVFCDAWQRHFLLTSCAAAQSWFS